MGSFISSISRIFHRGTLFFPNKVISRLTRETCDESTRPAFVSPPMIMLSHLHACIRFVLGLSEGVRVDCVRLSGRILARPTLTFQFAQLCALSLSPKNAHLLFDRKACGECALCALLVTAPTAPRRHSDHRGDNRKSRSARLQNFIFNYNYPSAAVVNLSHVTH